MFLEKEEMKFIVLYVLKQYKAPITSDTFYEILTWNKEIMGFFDAAEKLSELVSDNYIEKTFYRNESCYTLTEDGNRAIELFAERFPKSVKNRIDAAIGKIRYDALSDPNAVYAEVLPVNRTDFAARCTYLEDHTPMLELSLNAGSKKQAEAAAKYFKEHSKEIYEGILKLCMPEE